MSASQQSRNAIIKAHIVFVMAVFVGGYIGLQHSDAIAPIVFVALGVFFAWIVYRTNRPKPDASRTAPFGQ